MEEQKKAFDASAIAPATDSTIVEITNPIDKTDTGIRIEVYGKDSKTYKDVQRKQLNKRLRQMARRVQLQLTAEETEQEALDVLVACTKSWSGLGWKDQPTLPFTPDNARMVYEQVPTIREQVEDAINDRGNYLKR